MYRVSQKVHSLNCLFTKLGLRVYGLLRPVGCSTCSGRLHTLFSQKGSSESAFLLEHPVVWAFFESHTSYLKKVLNQKLTYAGWKTPKAELERWNIKLYHCPRRIHVQSDCSHQVGPLTQGLNSGVALFDLACLRQSKVSQKVTADYETILFDLYMFLRLCFRFTTLTWSLGQWQNWWRGED